MTTTWNDQLLDQLTWHWDHQLRPRLAGLTDEEHLWEPVPGCWSVRPRAASHAPMQLGTGDAVLEFAIPEPAPAPVTTIAWRLAHVTVGVYAERVASHFGGPPASYRTWDYTLAAGESLARLDAAHAAWVEGVRFLGEDGLDRPCGPAEGPFAEHPLSALVLHVHREVLHHGAEISLLRDLYAHRRS